MLAGRIRNAVFGAAFIALLAELAVAATPPRAHLLRDIFPGPSNSDPELAGIVNGALLFFATDEAHGRELWRSDGTADGTQLVRDIRPGPEGSIGYGGSAIFAGRLAFAASDGQGGAQLWSSDGTEAGTVLVRDAQPGLTAATVRLLTPAGERMWFTVQANFYDENLRGEESLWTTDLTTDGTERLAPIGYWEPGFSGGTAAVASLTPFKDGVLVSRKDAFECCERTSLQNLDSAGATVATLYQNDRGGHLMPLFPVVPIVAADTTYFAVDDWSGLSCGLRRSDGVATESIDIGAPPCGLSALAGFGNDLLLSLEPMPLQIFRATPMASTLSLVADLGDGFVPYQGSVATPAGVYFSVGRADANELWLSENATDPPSLLRRFEGDETGPVYLRALTRTSDGVLFWIGDTNGHNNTLWRSRGSTDATRPIGTLPTDVSAGAILESASAIFLTAYDDEHGGELWALDRRPECSGDCDANGTIGIADIILAIDIALGVSSRDACPTVDANADLQVSVDEIVTSVYGALYGCAAAAQQL